MRGGVLDYSFHSNGNIKTTILDGVTVKATEYDIYGRLTKETDPNYGSYEYGYNAFRDLVSKKDPKGTIYSYTYEPLGRVKTKTGPEGIYTYTYNTAIGANSGKMVQLIGPGVTHNYNYGIGEKINYEEMIMGSQIFKTEYTYDNKGRMATRKYPNGKTVSYGFNINDGDVADIGLNGNYVFLYSTFNKNAFGQVTELGQGTFKDANDIFFSKAYTHANYNSYGFLTEQKTRSLEISMGFYNLTRHFVYNFESSTANLLQRKDLKYNLQEDFIYDNINRLTSIQGQKLGANPVMFIPQSINYTLDENGNIKQKSDAGTFSYDQANRVSEIDPYINIPSNTQNLTYTPFNKVSLIEEGNNKAGFSYGADGVRNKMELFENNILKKTKYYAPNYEKEVDAITGQVRELCYVTSPAGGIVAVLERKNGIDKTYYVLSDHLGSITHILDENGNIIEEKSFDAWGRARNPQTWTALPVTGLGNGWDRGYTSHEHISQFGIINMNGRLYDPVMGRMFSPDPYIMGDDNTQGYNRYTYALNNPLKYTDPDGEWVHIVIGAIIGGGANLFVHWNRLKGWKDYVAAFGIGAVAGAVGAATGGAAFTLAGGAGAGAGGFMAGAAGGFWGSAASAPIQSMGNSAYFGDPAMTSEQYVISTLTGTLLGGLTNGTLGAANGRNFFSGRPIPVKINSLDLLTTRPLAVEINNEVVNSTYKPGSSAAIKSVDLEDLNHSFPKLVDNVAGFSNKVTITGGDGIQRSLYQVSGSYRGVDGIFEWMVENGQLVHRVFIPGGGTNGVPNVWPGSAIKVPKW